MVLCLREPPGGFCDVGCCCCCFLPHWRFFISLLFDIIPHPSVDYRRVFTPILYFQPSPSQSDSRHFHFQPFRYLLTASATVLSGHFLPTGVFYLTLLPNIFGTFLTFWHNLLLSRFHWEPAVTFLKVAGLHTDPRNTDPAHLFV